MSHREKPPPGHEVEITRPPTLDERQSHVLEMHSVFNVLNVAVFQIDAVGHLVGDSATADRFMDQLLEWHAGLGEPDRALAELRRAPEIRERLIAWMEEARSRTGEELRADLDERIDNLVSIFAVLEERVAELVRRTSSADPWVTLSFERLRADVRRTFRAIEKNAFGRWRIVFSRESRPAGSYLLEIGLWSADRKTIAMPAVLEDVLLDLSANARKFTSPGGDIRITLAEEPDGILLRVADSGRGIPEDEIEEVVRFGHRARNQDGVSHTGGGFGLTKACQVAHAFGGRMWIRSSPGVGTTVTIRIPRRPGPLRSGERGGRGRPPSGRR